MEDTDKLSRLVITFARLKVQKHSEIGFAHNFVAEDIIKEEICFYYRTDFHPLKDFVKDFRA